MLPVQAFVTLTSVDRFSAKIQILAMTVIINANLSQDIFSSVMSSLVTISMHKHNNLTVSIPLHQKRVDTIVNILKRLADGRSLEGLETEANKSARTLQAAHHRKISLKKNSSLYTYISLADAINALKDISLGR